MNRLYKLELKLNKVIDEQGLNNINRDETLEWEKLHMASSARIAWILALERGIDPELSACAAAVHDYGRIISGKQKDHAEFGYTVVGEFLKNLELFSIEEIETIMTAVKNHSKKTEIGTPIEEIVKDADVIDCYQYGTPFDRPEKEVRYNKWLNTRTK